MTSEQKSPSRHRLRPEPPHIRAWCQSVCPLRMAFVEDLDPLDLAVSAYAAAVAHESNSGGGGGGGNGNGRKKKLSKTVGDLHRMLRRKMSRKSSSPSLPSPPPPEFWW